MKVIVTGSKGMLGKDLVPVLENAGHEVRGTDVDELDLRDFEATRDLLETETPETIIHCAAMTNVDGCEDDPDSAFSINALATRNVSISATELGAKVIYISTDFVFDGSKSSPYHEFDKTSTISVYGNSKLAGEIFLRQFCPRSAIVRTAWLYGHHGWNFVDWVIKTAKEKNSLSIVTDQRGSPTYTIDLARQVEKIMAMGSLGIYHAAGLGGVSRFEWTKRVLEYAGLNDVQLGEITSAQLNQKAQRPNNSHLDTMCLRLDGICVMRPWEESLLEYIKSFHLDISGGAGRQ